MHTLGEFENITDQVIEEDKTNKNQSITDITIETVEEVEKSLNKSDVNIEKNEEEEKVEDQGIEL